MSYLAIVEIPKGTDRRIHMSYDGSGFIDLGPIRNQILVNDGVMPVCYGYIQHAINKSEDDNVDTIILSSQPHNTGDIIEVEVIGMLTRKDGDHKIIAIDSSVSIQNFMEIEFQERTLILKFFGYTSEISSIDSKDKAIEYLQKCMIKK